MQQTGKIGFQELAQVVSKRWKETSEEDKAPFEAMAKQDKLRFQEEMGRFNAWVKDQTMLQRQAQVGSVQKAAPTMAHAPTNTNTAPVPSEVSYTTKAPPATMNTCMSPVVHNNATTTPAPSVSVDDVLNAMLAAAVQYNINKTLQEQWGQPQGGFQPHRQSTATAVDVVSQLDPAMQQVVIQALMKQREEQRRQEQAQMQQQQQQQEQTMTVADVIGKLDPMNQQVMLQALMRQRELQRQSQQQ